MKIHISDTFVKQKPNNDMVKKLNNELNRKSRDLSLSIIRKSIVNGVTFTPAVFETPILDDDMKTLIITKEQYENHFNKTAINPYIKIHKIKSWEVDKPITRRKYECWSEQQLFCLDFDDGTPSKIVNKNIKSLGLHACFVYNTFSSTEEKEKYRIVFQTKEPITDYRVAQAIQNALMAILPMCDPSCKDASRLFFGTNNKKVRFNEDNYLDIEQLFKALYQHYKVKDAANYSHNIERFCNKNGMSICNNIPVVTTNQKLIDSLNKTDEYIVNTNGFTFSFDVTESQARYRECEVVQTVDKNDKKIKKIKSSYSFEVHRDFDFNKLESKCELVKVFVEGQEHIDHQDLMRLMTNLIHVEGGQKYFLDNLAASINLYNSSDKYNKMRNEMGYCLSQQYSPYNCDTGCDCPYINECCHSKNMLEQVLLKKKEIQKMDIEDTGLELNEAFEEMKKFMIEHYNRPK